MAKRVGFKAFLPEFKSLLCHFLSVYLWTLYVEDFFSVSENYNNNPYPKRLF